jgi:A/G-specific adenine glycosylase
MAQQTQVGRVVEYYERWLARWPSPAALAAASPADVLTAWVGLGYNRRALRLREAAAIVARDGWPRDAAGLRTLPGVGPYTAAAVASFAFGERVAPVDTNVRRLAARLGAQPSELLPARRHADWNQAAMELGAVFCTARAPRCHGCPAGPWCPSRGRVTTAPRPRRSPAGRFEDSDRWVRGRVIAALAAGEEFPSTIAPARLERALVALEREGLVERDGAGPPRLPR